MKLIPVILCGGVGSRLWPVSRDSHPKPFIRIHNGLSLLQNAFQRAMDLDSVTEVYTVTNRDLLFKIEDEFKAVNSTNACTSFILEPFGRNTAAAVLSAAMEIRQRHGNDAVMLVMAADHLIDKHMAFAEAVQSARLLASQGQLVTFGIQPQWPETGYGYIEAEGTRVVRFVEKPSEARANEYVQSGRFLWNSGMFCFTAGSIIDEFSALQPALTQAMEACLAKSRKAQGEGFVQVELEAASFEAVPDVSIDYAIMEKTTRAAVVACDIGWSDIGSWLALGDLAPADAHGNRIQGDALLVDTNDTTIYGDRRIVGTVGLKGVVIVDTADALLVADKASTQKVKELYAQLKSRNHEAHRLHQTVHRPWGTYTVLEEGPGFKIKRIEVKPGASLSLQLHKHRSEHWVVVSGEAIVVNGSQQLPLQQNQSTYIPAGTQHRLMNPGTSLAVIIEVQTGGYLGEDDIVRLQDVYGRA